MASPALPRQHIGRRARADSDDAGPVSQYRAVKGNAPNHQARLPVNDRPYGAGNHNHQAYLDLLAQRNAEPAMAPLSPQGRVHAGHAGQVPANMRPRDMQQHWTQHGEEEEEARLQEEGSQNPRHNRNRRRRDRRQQNQGQGATNQPQNPRAQRPALAPLRLPTPVLVRGREQGHTPNVARAAANPQQDAEMHDVDRTQTQVRQRAHMGHAPLPGVSAELAIVIEDSEEEDGGHINHPARRRNQHRRDRSRSPRRDASQDRNSPGRDLRARSPQRHTPLPEDGPRRAPRHSPVQGHIVRVLPNNTLQFVAIPPIAPNPAVQIVHGRRPQDHVPVMVPQELAIAEDGAVLEAIVGEIPLVAVDGAVPDAAVEMNQPLAGVAVVPNANAADDGEVPAINAENRPVADFPTMIDRVFEELQQVVTRPIPPEYLHDWIDEGEQRAEEVRSMVQYGHISPDIGLAHSLRQHLNSEDYAPAHILHRQIEIAIAVRDVVQFHQQQISDHLALSHEPYRIKVTIVGHIDGETLVTTKAIPDNPSEGPPTQPKPVMKTCCCCSNEQPESETIALGCSHIYCGTCLVRYFARMLPEKNYDNPPKCCEKHIPLTNAVSDLMMRTLFVDDNGKLYPDAKSLQRKLEDQYKRRAREKAKRSPLYCHECGEWIEDWIEDKVNNFDRARNVAGCNDEECRSLTCTICKRDYVDHYRQECPQDLVLQALNETLEGNDMKKCPHCGIAVEKMDACNHMR